MAALADLLVLAAQVGCLLFLAYGALLLLRAHTGKPRQAEKRARGSGDEHQCNAL